MANSKEYRIVINGVQESINALDALVAKAEELSRKLSGGITVDVKPQVQQPQQSANTAQTQAAEKTFEVQAQITAEIEKQNDALQQQSTLVQSSAGDYREALDAATAILGTYEDNLSKLAEYDAQLKEIAAEKKTIQKIGVEDEESRAVMQQLLADEMKYKQLKSETLSVLKTETKLLQAEEGSYDQMSATVGRLRDALRASGGNLSPEQFNALSSAVSELDAQLKDADKGMGQFFRNVGNYPSAAEGFSKIKVEIAGITQEFDGARPAIQSLRNAMAQLAVEGRTDSEEYRGLADQMRNLQMAMATVNDEVERSKDASSGMHDTIEMLQGFASIAAVGQGFSQLFGADDSAITEQIQKMTTLMGILQGLNELKNQIATGTGIGPALSKLMNVTGLSTSMKELGDNTKVLASRLGLIPPAAEAGAVGMSTFAVATKVATAAVKTFWRALLVGLIIEGVVLTIEALVDGIKALYGWIHDYISLSDDVERANKAAADSFDALKTGVDGYNAARDRDVARGVMTQYQADSDKLRNLNKNLKDNVDLLKERLALNAENADITPKLADWTQLAHEVENINRLSQIGKEETSAWGDVYKDVLADVLARMEQLDTTDEKALQTFIQWTKDSPQVQAALTWALNSGDESMKNLAQSIKDGTANAFELVNSIYQVQAAMRAAEIATANLRQELELREKYGNKWSVEQRVLQSNKEIDESNLTDGEKAKLKADREKEIRDSENHGRKQVSVAKRTGNDLVNIERQIQQDKLAIMRDGLLKTLATIDTERSRRIEAAKKMQVSEEKRREAIAAINARYDKEEADARKKWREEYIKAEEEFRSKVERMRYDTEKTYNETAKTQSELRFGSQSGALTQETMGELLKPFAEQLESLGMLRKIVDSDREKLLKSLDDTESELKKKLSEMGKTQKGSTLYISLKLEYDKLSEEYKKTKQQLNDLGDAEASYALVSEKIREDIERDGVAADDPWSRLKTWDKYYGELFKLKQQWGERDLELQKSLNEMEASQQLEDLAKQRNQEVEALAKRYESYIENAESLEKRNELEEKYNAEWLELRQAFDDKESEIWEAHLKEDERLTQQHAADTQNEYADMYSSLINEINKYFSDVENVRSKIKDDNTDAWGFFNIKEFRSQRSDIIHDYENVMSVIKVRMQELREDFAAGRISLGDFSDAYAQLNELKEKMQDVINELDSDNGMEDFMKGVDTWIQQIGQAANQILSSVFEYRNSEFERMREELDRQIELVQEKYDEMEELAQRHKDAMDEIEDELTTARGDRRQHLIDALSAEIDAQRRALAEQKKAEKEKKRLEADGDKLELQRKKEQKRQSLITAVINAALAISQAAANKWPVPAIPLMALAAATGAAQVAAISAQKYAKGGLLQGPTHERGGIKVGGGIEVEGGEFVTNRRTTSQNLDLLYYINSAKKRLNIDDFIEFYSKGGTRSPLLGAKGKFEDGGLMPSLEIASRVAEVVVAQDDRPVVVSVVDINDAQARVRRVQTMAGLER